MKSGTQIHFTRFRGVETVVMKLKKNVMLLIGLCCLLMTGCANFIVPEPGSVASEESRIVYKGGDSQDGILENDDITLQYTLSGGGGQTRFTGELEFHRSLTDSFPVVKTFFLKLNWLDGDGAVLQTVDITPGYNFRAYAPNNLRIDREIPVASGAASYCFNYYGVFQGEKPDVSEEWDIFLFPFTAP